MTSHIRHRRGAIPGTIEPGEVHVDPVGKQLTAGDLAPTPGALVPLLAIRYFDARASYLIHEYVVQGGGLYRSRAAVPPGAFNPAQWEAIVGGTTTPGAEHTPLHGFADGANHTLILHGFSDDNSYANTIDFLNLSGATTARLWSQAVGTPLRIQSAGSIAFAANHVGFDDSNNALRINPVNTPSSSPATGTLTVAGGLGVAGDAHFGGANLFAGDIWATRPSAPTTGVYYFVDNTHYLYWDGNSFSINGGKFHISDPTTAALTVAGGLGVGGNINAGGNLSGGNLALGANGAITNASGYLVVQSAAALYLRSPTVTYINDLSGAPVYTGGDLNASGSLRAVQGGLFQNDVTILRSQATTTGAIFFGDAGTHYLYFNGTDLDCTTQRITTPDPIAASHAATKAYVDAQITTITGGAGGGPFLPLTGGTMTGQIVAASSSDLDGAGSVSGAIRVTGLGATWAAMPFLVNNVFGTNFGLRSDGNFWMGGWSHGAGAAYKFWTTRELSLAPFSDIRLAFAAEINANFNGPPGNPEPFPGAVMVGLTYQSVTRYRYLQVMIGSSWFTVALA
jgi:hypothetical protein